MKPAGFFVARKRADPMLRCKYRSCYFVFARPRKDKQTGTPQMSITQTPADVAARLTAYATEYNAAVWPNLALPTIDDDALLTMELRSENYSAAHNMGEHEANGICGYSSSTECGERAAAAEFVECNDAAPEGLKTMTEEAPAPVLTGDDAAALVADHGSKIVKEAYAVAAEAGLTIEATALTDQTLRLYIEDTANGGTWLNIIQQTQIPNGRHRHYAAAATHHAAANPRDVLVSRIVPDVRTMAARAAARRTDAPTQAMPVIIPTLAELPTNHDCAVVTAADGSKTCNGQHAPAKQPGQHFLTYPTNSTAVCGSDMVGRRNSRTDTDPFETTCPRCVAWIEANADFFE